MPFVSHLASTRSTSVGSLIGPVPWLPTFSGCHRYLGVIDEGISKGSEVSAQTSESVPILCGQWEEGPTYRVDVE